MKALFAFVALVPSLLWGQVDTVFVIYGCTHPVSCNYNDEATVDDGSCLDCDTPYEVGALLCDHYHGIEGIWDWWIVLKGCGMEVPEPSCDTIYLQLPPDTIQLPQDTLYLPQDTAYLPSDTIYVTSYISTGIDTLFVLREVDCFTGFPCGGGCDSTLYIPNAFTPDGDGLNDTWHVVTDPECWREWECLIFDRWGSLVWKATDPLEQFYGITRERLLPAGVYSWLIEAETLTATEPVSLRGHLTLIR